MRSRAQPGSRPTGSTPSISITPLPGRPGGSAGSAGAGVGHQQQHHRRPGPSGASALSGQRHGASPGGAGMHHHPGRKLGGGGAAGGGGGGGGGSFVICEICDGYIKDLEQLRNHMLWIHKVERERQSCTPNQYL